MPFIVHSQVLRLHRGAVALGLAANRNELLAGIAQSLTSAIPTAGNVSGQLLADLDRLNDLGRLPDGSVPLRTWLENALALHGARGEAEIFREVLALVPVHGSVATTSTAPQMPSAPAATGGSTFDVSIHNSTVGSAAFGDHASARGSISIVSPPAPRTSTSSAPTAATGLQSVYLSYAPADESFVERLSDVNYYCRSTTTIFAGASHVLPLVPAPPSAPPPPSGSCRHLRCSCRRSPRPTSRRTIDPAASQLW